jgi:hypothetical protein
MRDAKASTFQSILHISSTLDHWHHSEVYEKLTHDLEIVPRVLMTLATEGHGELGHCCSVILDDEIVNVNVVFVVIAFIVVAVLLRVFNGWGVVIIFTCLLVA